MATPRVSPVGRDDPGATPPPSPDGEPPAGARLVTAVLDRLPRGWPLAALLLTTVYGALVPLGLWGDLAGRYISGNVPDGIHYTWWLGWTPHALGDGMNPLTSTAMNWPDGVSLMNNTTLLLPALLLSPVTVLFGAAASLNVLNVLAVPACVLGGWWGARRLGLGQAAAVAAGAAYGLSPAIVNSLVGHITMAFAPALPVLVALSVDAWRGREGVSWRRIGVVLGLVAAAQVFVGEEVLFQAGVAALLVLLVAAVSRPRQIAAGGARLARTLGVALAVFLPITGYPLFVQFFGPLAHHGNPFLQDYYGADVFSFTTPTRQLWLHRDSDLELAAKFPGGIEEHLAYLGWPLLVVCVVVAARLWRDVRVRAAFVGLVVAMVLSVGGRLWVAGEWTERRGPYRFLQQVPVVEASLATRFGLLAALFAAALLGLGVQAVLRSDVPRRRLAAAALAAVCILPLVPRPLPTEPVPATPSYFTDGSITGDPVLVVLPYPVAARPVAMRWQSESAYRFSMPGGYFLGPGPDGHAYVGGGADPATARLLDEVAATGEAPSIGDEQRAQAVSDIRAWGADAVVLGPDWASPALAQTVTDLTGVQPREDGGVLVWDVRGL